MKRGELIFGMIVTAIAMICLAVGIILIGCGWAQSSEMLQKVGIWLTLSVPIIWAVAMIIAIITD